MATEIDRDQPELFDEVALELATPAQMVLRPAVDEQDRRRILRPHSRTWIGVPPPPVTVAISMFSS